MVRTFVRGEVHVHYGQIYVESGADYPDLMECFAGQANGLCGAAAPGTLYLHTGLHTGGVGFTVEAHESPPALDDAWEEVVEVSFAPHSSSVALVQWAGEASWDLDLSESSYRVRYCATGMDPAHEADTRLDDEPMLDRYLLQFWPAAPSPDRVVRRTSEIADYWHGYAAELPPSPPPPTPEERAEAERRALLEQQRQEEESRRLLELHIWGGRPPSDGLRHLSGNAQAMAVLDRDLAEAIVAAGPETQRSIARWTTRAAYTVAGLADLDWAASALDALDGGRDLPPPFDDHDQVWERLFTDPRVPRTTVTSVDGDTPNMSQQAMAVPALFGAVGPDPLDAALEALFAASAAFGREGYKAFFGEVRGAFGL